ncbi:hypothetical protein HGRIS_013191 [Hohenbuehelia grisea]
MRVFVTVGSTKFDSLVQAVLSPEVIGSLRNKQYTELVIQCGNSESGSETNIQAGTETRFTTDGVNIVLWRFKPSLNDEFTTADLIISHAGSGTILDVLRTGKPLIVVPNPTLLDNHQEELASVLYGQGYLQYSTAT